MIHDNLARHSGTFDNGMCRFQASKDWARMNGTQTSTNVHSKFAR
jgi:hypothetical protein